MHHLCCSSKQYTSAHTYIRRNDAAVWLYNVVDLSVATAGMLSEVVCSSNSSWVWEYEQILFLQ